MWLTIGSRLSMMAKLCGSMQNLYCMLSELPPEERGISVLTDTPVRSVNTISVAWFKQVGISTRLCALCMQKMHVALKLVQNILNYLMLSIAHQIVSLSALCQ